MPKVFSLLARNSAGSESCHYHLDDLGAFLASSKGTKKRLDLLVVEKGLADDLDMAKRLIMAGKILVGDQRHDKPGQMVFSEVPLRLKGESSRFVSRAGDKLFYALEHFNLASTMALAHVLDVGASTGGFTDCCLKLGAQKVVALDVGTGQLAWELRSDERVTSLERTDFREFNPSDFEPFQWVVADVSFNSLARLAPAFKRVVAPSGTSFLLLVKPQFELSREDVPLGGVVQDPLLRQKALNVVSQAMTSEGLTIVGSVDSQVSGRRGNQEIFLYAKG